MTSVNRGTMQSLLLNRCVKGQNIDDAILVMKGVIVCEIIHLRTFDFGKRVIKVLSCRR